MFPKVFVKEVPEELPPVRKIMDRISPHFGGFTSQVMMQADMNASGTFVRTMEDLFHNELGKNIWVYMSDIFVFSDTFEGHVKDVTKACSKL